MNILKEYYEKYKELILYLVFGVGTTVVNWASYCICIKYVGINIFISNILSWVFATIFAFITNKIWVFDSKRWDINIFCKELFLFVSTRLGTGAFEILFVPILINLGLNQMIFGIEGMLSKIIVSITVVILNYVFSKLLIFKDKK
ncbi:GtrA family protein [Anaerofustis stercorihominis]|uniref:GtrA family protein n=1 Tax=Anaerofustis stercorihominis TaxID=214853 RepID=UPI00214B65A9|nr:GtrA family protein [Anaerofustis stercorihominis]MCR2033576.1 GtrA family protein [Anaerofustis stercorihominis]